jgi:hypothetical protein
MKKNYFLILSVLFLPICVLAQKGEKEIHFLQGSLTPDTNISTQQFKKENIQRSFFRDRYFVLIQFAEIPSTDLQKQLKEAGVTLETYLSGDAYLASVKSAFDFSLAGKYNIISINSVPDNYKVDPAVKKITPSFDKEDLSAIGVSFYSSFDKATAIKELEALGASIVKTKITIPNVVFIRAKQMVIDSIAALPFVSYIGSQSLNPKPLNYEDVAMHGASGFNVTTGKDLEGQGVTIGMGDQGNITTHVDFTGRIILRTSDQPGSHSTHVAGTAVGAGIVDVVNHGMAPKATMIDQYFTDIISNAPTYVTDYDMVASNNSYTTAATGCAGEGVYDFYSNYADGQINSYDKLIHVFAAGNDGGYTCGAFPLGFATIKSGWQTAKNVLTVGNINSVDYTIFPYDSHGPVADGRIKPEIVTSGMNILSTFPFNTYQYDQGTSMSAPVVTGSLALVYQRYKQLHAGSDPKSALMKAVLCNTAEDMGNPGPDYSFGFGMLNVRRAVEAIDSNWYATNSITNGGNAASTIYISKNARRLKVMLYWADVAANVGAAVAIVNDLDLTVTTPSAVVHHPFILNSAPAHVNDNAVEGVDHTNNIEQVTIENPVAGTYNVNVKGFAVPFGPQPYALTYEIIDSSVTVEYPFGGETLVPGDIENLRWSGYGSDSNTYTIQYSPDNGSSWINIATNVPAASRTYPWTVPAVATNKALIKVSRNGSSLSGQSSFDFTILGRPVLVDTVMCQGYVKLNWGSIPTATSYDVLQLAGDSMQVIANTTDTSFLVKSLNKNQTYWFGVSAKNGATAGRRSISVSAIPSGGPCTLPDFNNDLIIDSILSPNTARNFFSNATNATAPVTVRIRNLGSTDVTAPFTVSYNCAGGTATETVNAIVPADGTYDYTFTTPYTFNPAGFHYNFQAWATDIADSNHANDTAYKVVKLLANPVITTLPVSESFETVATEDYMYNVLGLDGDDALDMSANTTRGRARPFINSGFAISGKNAMTLDQTPFGVPLNTDSLTVTYNLSSYVNTPLRYDFFYANQGVVYDSADAVWIRGNENDPWIRAYDLFANQNSLGNYKHAQFSIDNILKSVVPAQTASATFQIRFGAVGQGSVNSPQPDNSTDNGYTFDSLTLGLAANDVALTQIISPDSAGCGTTATTPITVQVRNYNNIALTNVHVNYQINGGAVVNEIISIPADTVVNYTFSQLADLSAYTNYTINTWVFYASDTYHDNDSILNYTIHNSPVIQTYPYLEGFENNNGYFYTTSSGSDWQWGAPHKTIINKAANGNNCWVTDLNGNYQDDQTSYLYSPCFDLSSLAHPMLSFSHIFQTENLYDFIWVEYSTDGMNWQRLGASGSGVNWYNNIQGWTGADTVWHVASISIPTNASSVKLRFVLNSDPAVNYTGVGIDDIHVFDSATIYTGVSITNNTQNVSGNNWIDFTSGGKMIASINPNGMNLGSTNVQVYPSTGSSRNVNDHYYLNRDIVIQPSNQPAGNISVRFYYTDVEADSLINATIGCAGCTAPPKSAYELGVTKFNGNLTNENGTLSDNAGGYYLYIPRSNVNVVPYNNGYYSEFSTNGFGEFWMDNLDFIDTLSAITFTAVEKMNQSQLKLTTPDDAGIYKYIIERSGNNSTYDSIGYILSNNVSVASEYDFTDVQPLSDSNYYRIKIVASDGSVTYSASKLLVYNDYGIWTYPNPVKDGMIYISSLSNASSAVLMDESGKRIQSYTLQGKNNSINVSSVHSGMYMLKIVTENSTQIKKVFVE